MLDTKILVVDDDSNISELLRLYFENEGYEVKTANDGAEGVNAFKAFEPDLVLLDVMMPKKDGWQVLREIREMSSKPVIMITAKGDVLIRCWALSWVLTTSLSSLSIQRSFPPVPRRCFVAIPPITTVRMTEKSSNTRVLK